MPRKIPDLTGTHSEVVSACSHAAGRRRTAPAGIEPEGRVTMNVIASQGQEGSQPLTIKE